MEGATRRACEGGNLGRLEETMPSKRSSVRREGRGVGRREMLSSDQVSEKGNCVNEVMKTRPVFIHCKQISAAGAA